MELVNLAVIADPKLVETVGDEALVVGNDNDSAVPLLDGFHERVETLFKGAPPVRNEGFQSKAR
jgi:hypothetical protein